MASGNESAPNFLNDMKEIREDIQGLKQSIDFIIHELAHQRESIESLQREQYSRAPAEIPKRDSVDKLSQAYLGTVSTIAIVQKVFITESGDTATFWTVIDNPPDNNSSEQQTYEEQVNTLHILKENLPIDFHIISETELTSKECDEPIPPKAKLIWQR